MSEIETVEVTVQLPKTVVDFIKDMEGDVPQYISHCIVDLTTSYIENVNARYLMEKFNLKPAFKAYGVLPSYYEDP